jgi:hypothetical protein
MHEKIKEFFKSEGIEYFCAVSCEHLQCVNPRLIEREDLAARSAIVFLLPYYTGEAENLSVYAASLDYHIIIKRLTGKLC